MLVSSRPSCLTPIALLLAAASLALPAAPQTGASSELKSDLDRGQAALRAGDSATAARDFTAALQLDPSSVEAHANLGAIAFFRGDCQAAEPHFRAALRAAPSLTKAQALLGVCEHRLGEPAAADDMKEAFAKLDDPRLHLQIGIELANLYYQQGDLEATASILRSLVATNPDNVDVLFFAQRVYSELADNTLNKLAILAPNSARMEQLIAERLINAGDLKDAVIHYRKAIALDPRLPGMHFELAEALMEGTPHDAAAQQEAARELQSAIRIDGDSPGVECELGRVALLQFHTADAETHYKKAAAMDPHNAAAQMGLADLAQKQGNLQQAATYLHQAVESDPLNADAHYQLCQIDKRLNLDAEAQKELKLFLDIRASRDKVRQLYLQMNPQTAPAVENPPAKP
ncbi:MAG TPA: tetratricopeptide repeat protein [Acidobacteriaceae bacterium]|jgi:tetratricopeptide (TPR) repeat protein|nr:tetratricopeptide repeat protein [Acidobacteriaceae bacterium]